MAAMSQIPTPAGPHVLVVDDEVVLAGMVSNYLQRAGFRISVVHDGLAALALVNADRPDVVVLDLGLPGKDGMIHISKLANHRVEKVEDVVKIGDTLEVKVAEIDAQGRVNLVRNDITYDNTAAAAPRRAEGFRARPPRRDGRN